LAKGNRQRRDVAPSIGRVVIPRDLVIEGRHHVGGLAAGDVKQVVRAESGLEGITRWRLIRTGLPCGWAAAGGRRRWRASGHTEVVLLDGIGRVRSPYNGPERWFPVLGRVPFRQRERNRTHSDQQKQVERTSNQMCSGSAVNARFHFACVPVRK